MLRFTPDTFGTEQHVESFECSTDPQTATECPCGWAYSPAAIAERRASLIVGGRCEWCGAKVGTHHTYNCPHGQRS